MLAGKTFIIQPSGVRGLSFLIATHDVVDGAFFAGQRDAWRVRGGFDVAATFQEKLLMLFLMIKMIFIKVITKIILHL